MSFSTFKRAMKPIMAAINKNEMFLTDILNNKHIRLVFVLEYA